jgi:predicted transcriptional regulator
LSFRTEEETKELLDQIAASMDRNRNWVINDAIAGYVDLYKWQAKEVEKGAADIKAGRTLTTEQVHARILKRHVAKTAKRK